IGALATAARDDSSVVSPSGATTTPSGAAVPTSTPPNPAAPSNPAKPPAATPAPRVERPKSEPAPESPPPEPETPSAPRIPRRYGWVGVAGMLGGGLDRSSPRYGGRAWLGVRVVPHVAALVTGSTSVRPRDSKGLAASFLDGGVGIGVSIGSPSLPHLDLHGELLREQLVADARLGTRSQDWRRVAFAGLAGVDGVLPIGDVFDLVLGIDGTFRPATRVRVGSEPDGATRNFELGASAGLRGEL
ncbi:MAG TPA: hypothetical protein VMI54_25995, partial [Polyangiaceae bacterium]|nr:hypothetical protein [Polyangiaceae bacterium]